MCVIINTIGGAVSMEDMHIHVRDAINDYNLLKSYVNRCVELGINKILMLDHGPRLSKRHISRLNTKNKIMIFKENVEKLKIDYPHLKIFCGIELDFCYDKAFNDNNNKLTDIGFDYVISSIHHYKFTNGRDYLKAVIQMIDTCKFDIIGHMLLKYDWKKCTDLIDVILNKVKEKGLIIEINTSDRSRWDSETLEYMIIKMNENGINYTIGSDAHSVSEIGHMISETTKKVISINKKL